MTKTIDQIEINCDCGKEHKLKNLQLFYNDIVGLITLLKKRNVKKLRCFINVKDINNEVLTNIITKIRESKIRVIISELEFNHAEVLLASRIDYLEEDYVLMIGNNNLIDIVKYYSCSYDLDYSVITYGIIYDFSFSKYARLYDGVIYDFYVTSAPEIVVCYTQYYSKQIVKKIRKYIMSKQLAYFENVLEDRIQENSICSKINIKILKAIRCSNKINNINDAINILCFLGLAMSFFGESKSFFGAELGVCNMLEVLTGYDFLDCYFVASDVVHKTYTVALSTNLKVLNLNLNRRIDKLKKILKLPALKCLSYIKKQKGVLELEKRIRIIKALQYMLADLLEYDLSYDVEKFNSSVVDLRNSLYSAVEFTNKYFFLNLLRDLGYLENLI